jgi:hypothetical protein
LEGEYNERLKIFTDGSLKDKRVGYAIVTPETTIKNRIKSQISIFSAEQEAIIKAIYISKDKEAIATVYCDCHGLSQYNDGSWRYEMDKKSIDETNKGASWPRKRKGQTDVDTEPLRNHGEREGRWGHKERVRVKRFAQGECTMHEIRKGNYRVEEQLSQPKQKGASGGSQTKNGVEQHIDTS